jgi:hypothetical protein
MNAPVNSHRQESGWGMIQVAIQPISLISKMRISIMKKTSLFSLTAALALLAIPFGSQAASWSCKNGSNVREIHIQTESPSSPVPCCVVNKKTTEGAADQTLWTAANDAGYCEEKATALVEKLGSLGWTCEEAKGGAGTAAKTNP